MPSGVGVGDRIDGTLQVRAERGVPVNGDRRLDGAHHVHSVYAVSSMWSERPTRAAAGTQRRAARAVPGPLSEERAGRNGGRQCQWSLDQECAPGVGEELERFVAADVPAVPHPAHRRELQLSEGEHAADAAGRRVEAVGAVQALGDVADRALEPLVDGVLDLRVGGRCLVRRRARTGGSPATGRSCGTARSWISSRSPEATTSASGGSSAVIRMSLTTMISC